MSNEMQDTMKDIIQKEINALLHLKEHLTNDYERAVNLLVNCEGKVILTGVGKSGHIGRKIAATLSSTGTPSFFVHSTEGVHGDLGMIENQDIVILISNSGNTREVLNLLPTLNKIGSHLIAITSNENSELGKDCNLVLEYSSEKEADHLELAPSVSTTTALLVGDVLALTVSAMKNFTKDDFHLYHPGGSLGEQIVRDKEKE